jgi:outer membrane protein assembly factor BamA
MKEIIPGDQYDLTKLKTSRDELSRRIQDHGYYYFIPEFVDLNADTTIEKYKIKLMVGKKKDLPEPILAVYKINNIVISNSQGKIDSLSKHDTIFYQNYKIISSGDILNKDILLRSIYFKKGDTYSYKAYQNTMTGLNSLGVFKYVNISFKRDKVDSLSYLLNIKIDLIMSDNISVDFAANLVTKSTGYSGPAVSAGITHGNTFNGAEKLHLALNGGFEWQWGNRKETQLGTYSYEFGVSSGLTLPRIIVPFRLKPDKPLLLQRTSINGDVSLLNRTAYYKMLSGKVDLDYQWSKNKNVRHTFSPVYINAVNLLATTTSFDSVVNENIYIRKSFEEQFIFGMRYEFNYNNTLTVRPNNFFYSAGINTSGNAIDLIAGMNKGSGERPYYFLNNIYSQFVKITSDFRYYRNGFNKSLVFRFYAGIGLPYGNSTALPYVEQFFSGGAYSIRGFTARYLGPGAYHQVDQSGYIDQSGDLKLETNLEYRFGMSKVLKGAFFIDAGNIWLVNEDVNRPGAKFDLNTFYDQVAVSAGFGLRFDFTFFVLRTDFGFPLRTPYVTDNRNWLFGTQKIFSGGLFHLAIGYPF